MNEEIIQRARAFDVDKVSVRDTYRLFEVLADALERADRCYADAAADRDRLAAELATLKGMMSMAEQFPDNSERDALQAQLAIDAPLAALARRYVEACNTNDGNMAMIGAEMIRLVRSQK
jgi:hypothetical protein